MFGTKVLCFTPKTQKTKNTHKATKFSNTNLEKHKSIELYYT